MRIRFSIVASGWLLILLRFNDLKNRRSVNQFISGKIVAVLTILRDIKLLKEYRMVSVQDCVIHARGMSRDFRKA